MINRTEARRRCQATAHGWAAWLMLLMGLVSCEPATDIGDDILPADDIMGAVYIDTLTVRASTVLVDSVATSNGNALLVGRYTDSRFGTLTARSYVRLGLAAGAFEPEPTTAYDSLVLLLRPDAYRYGDTTRLQTLQVHRLREEIKPNTTYYAFETLRFDATPLGRRQFRARRGLDTVRVRLDDALGRELYAAGRNRQLGTNDELEARLAGLVFAPGATDNAAVLRFSPTDLATVRLYYHENSTPATALYREFSLAAGARHFYQLQADRTGTLLSSLTATRQALPSARTAAEVYIQGGLGLQVRIEIPYLLDLNELDGTRVINSATLTLETVPGADTRYFPPPATLLPQLTTRGNRSLGALVNIDGSQVSMPYVRAVSPRTNLEQGSYSASLTSYCTAVLRRNIDNNGLLLTASVTGTLEQVILGGPNHPEHALRLKLYLTRIE